MTAPPTTAPETTTTATPDSPAETGSFLDLGDADMLAKLGYTPGDDEATAPAPDDTPTIDATPETPDETGGETEEAPPDDGEGAEAAAPPEKPAAPKATDFTVVLKDGTEVDYDPDALITFKAGGVERRLPLDRVVRLAQSGVHNEVLAGEVKELREYRQSVEDTVPQVQASLDRILEENHRLLTDDEYRQTKQAEWIENNTPEKQLERERAARKTLEKQIRDRETKHQVQTVLDRELPPVFAALEDHINADRISTDEVIGRMLQLLDPMKGPDGIVPQDRLPHVVSMIRDTLVPWAIGVADKRRSRAAAPEAAPPRAPSKAATTATVLAKRTLMRPVGSTGNRALQSGTPRPASDAPRKPPKNLDEGVEALVSRLVADTS